jgi:hypothetical protein
MRIKVRPWMRVVVKVVLVIAVILILAVAAGLCWFYRAAHDLSFAEEVHIDLRFINGVQARVLDQFFDQPLLSLEDLTAEQKEGEEECEPYDMYLLSRVTPRPGLLARFIMGYDLIIEIVEPEALRGQRYNIMPRQGSVLSAGEVVYGLWKVQRGHRFHRPLDVTTPVKYKVVYVELDLI